MSEYDSNDHGRCPECDGTDGNHYPGCLYEGTGGSGYRSPRGNNGMSTGGAVFIAIISFVLTAVVFMVLGVDVSNVPAIVIVIVYIIIVSVLTVIGSKR